MTWARWGMQPQPNAPLSLYVEVRFTKKRRLFEFGIRRWSSLGRVGGCILWADECVWRVDTSSSKEKKNVPTFLVASANPKPLEIINASRLGSGIINSNCIWRAICIASHVRNRADPGV
ncbi:uncharacterized protein RSE6_00514 [Rhynchosporium secalis]|uniref:Uncharacterized protein n=1 Tax=Rhynchosporium secalis TaxID=38038 RepID=A0A1E1LVI9_RHYSE|nr:uncharacterized protein RSE6_00514 [Rhynchosporium secalis]